VAEIRGKDMADKKQKNDINKLSFEEAIKELTSIVSKIEQGQIPLQDSLEQYERGMALIKHCRTILQQAEKRIEKISKEEEQGDSSQKSGDRRQ
jgi:exodeoxyribonuclease VII small subunit